MPVTFKVSNHSANSISGLKNSRRPPATVGDALMTTAHKSCTGLKEVLQSSLTDTDLPTFVPSLNGFVHGCLQAYNVHHNLVLRPDDVWITIVTQFAFYVEAREEEMREYFVGGQKEKKKLVVTADGDRYSVNFGMMASEMGMLLEANVKDKDLRDWIVPGFSTTTPNDKVVGAILMMCTLKNYFEYGFELACGIPAVTLEGVKSDWISLRTRLDKLLAFGDAEVHPHLHAWHQLLVPIFDNFVDCFTVFDVAAAPSDETRAEELRYFFQRICAITGNGSGPRYLSGWLAFFCAFNNEGQWQLSEVQKGGAFQRSFFSPPGVDPGIYGKKDAPKKDAPVWLPHINQNKIPTAYGEVDVELNDNGVLMGTKMVAGMVGYDIAGKKMDTVSLKVGWWMFVVEDEKSQEERERWWS